MYYCIDFLEKDMFAKLQKKKKKKKRCDQVRRYDFPRISGWPLGASRGGGGRGAPESSEIFENVMCIQNEADSLQNNLDAH